MEDFIAFVFAQYIDYGIIFDMSILKKIFFIDLIKGLSLTLKYNVSKSITIRYPDEEKWVPYQRFRGLHTLNRDAQGRELCVACELCAKICPTQCITVIPMEDDTGRGIADRVAKMYEINLVRCMFCGFCEDACPTTAIRMGREYELPNLIAVVEQASSQKPQ